MEFLPVFNNPIELENIKYDNKYQLKKIIFDCVQGSCYAIVINGEIIYNDYIINKTPEEIIIQDNIRQHFANNPFHLVRPGYIAEIYMYYASPRLIQVISDNGIYKLKIYK